MNNCKSKCTVSHQDEVLTANAIRYAITYLAAIPQI